MKKEETKITLGNITLTYLKLIEEEYSPIRESTKSNKKMIELEETLGSIGFVKLNEPKTHWEQKEYIKAMDNQGRAVSLVTYFTGKGENIRKEQSVKYDIAGIDKDVQAITKEINDRKERMYRTCIR